LAFRKREQMYVINLYDYKFYHVRDAKAVKELGDVAQEKDLAEDVY
jgi:hypothetical protein